MRTESDVFHATFINLAKEEPQPMIVENTYHDYIPFGSDNLFPQALARFARLSPNHRGIINSKHQYIIGDGITSEDESTQELFKQVNYEGESMTEMVNRLLLDDLIFGNGWIELITDRNQTFLWYNPIDATKCRLSKNLNEVMIHPDWGTCTGKDDPQMKCLPLYPNFKKDNRNDFPAYRSVYHLKRYEPEFVYYGIPQYIAAQDSVQIDFKTNKWNLARLKNAFKVSGILVVPVRDKAESKAVIDGLKKEHLKEGDNHKLMTITKTRARSDEKADVTQLIETEQHDEGSWEKLHAQSLSDMIVAHTWFRSLVSIADNTGFDTQRILNEYEIAQNTIITNYQKQYIGMFQRLYRDVLNQEIDMRFVNKPPLSSHDYKMVWEIRKEKGMEYDENDPVQQQIVGVKYAQLKVGDY